MSEQVLVQAVDGVLEVTINRPEAKNAMTKAAAEAIAAAMDRLDAEDDLRVGILTGAGGTFCSGMDLKGFLQGSRPTIPGRGFCGLTEAPPKKVLIAAIEGYALAGGFELALACDLLVASREAKFGLPEVKRGLIAAAGGVFRIVEQLPRKVAMRLLVTGEPITAAEALRWGLINDVVPDGTVVDAALALAERITVNAPLAVQASKRVAAGVDEGTITADEIGWTRTMREIGALMRSEDAKEGPLAFAEKRQPVWKAR